MALHRRATTVLSVLVLTAALASCMSAPSDSEPTKAPKPESTNSPTPDPSPSTTPTPEAKVSTWADTSWELVSDDGDPANDLLIWLRPDGTLIFGTGEAIGTWTDNTRDDALTVNVRDLREGLLSGTLSGSRTSSTVLTLVDADGKAMLLYSADQAPTDQSNATAATCEPGPKNSKTQLVNAYWTGANAADEYDGLDIEFYESGRAKVTVIDRSQIADFMKISHPATYFVGLNSSCVSISIPSLSDLPFVDGKFTIDDYEMTITTTGGKTYELRYGSTAEEGE